MEDVLIDRSRPIVHYISKYGEDDRFVKVWPMPQSAVEALTQLGAIDIVDGVIIGAHPVTSSMLDILQPWVDEPIGPRLDSWMIESLRE